MWSPRTARARAVTSAGTAGALGLALLASGLVALPGTAAASRPEAWLIETPPEPVDRYTARVDPQHLSGDSVVRPGLSAEQGEELLETAGQAAPGGFDPQEVLRAGELVGAPAALESVDGVLQLRGPRGVVVLGSGSPELTPAPEAATPGDALPYAVPETSPDAVSRDLLTRLEATEGVESVTPLHGGLVALAVPRGAPAPTGLDGLSDVVRDVAVPVLDLAGLPDDPARDRSWALVNRGGPLAGSPTGAVAVAGADLGVLGAWPRTRGAGVTVAVIDSGYAAHRDLVDTLWTNDGESCTSGRDADGNGKPADCHGWNFVFGNNDVTSATGAYESNNHGTMVGSSIAGAIGDGYGMSGVAPDVDIMPLVAGSYGSLWTSCIIEALYYAADNGADIINMSFGAPRTGGEADMRLEAAMSYAAAKGILLVAAAGNDGRNRDVAPVLPASSDNPNLITVGASTARDEKASFSGYGRSVDVFAPGQTVLVATSRPGEGYADGTSFASPLTAGVAALLQSADPSLRGAALRQRLIETSAPVPALTAYGAVGRIDARAALASVPAPLQVDADGLDGLRPDTSGSATLRLRGNGSGLPAGALGTSLRLVTTEPDGGVYDVVGAPLAGGPAGGGLTDDHGTVALTPAGLTRDALRSGVAVPLSTSLPEGRYALLVQLTSDGRAVGDRHAVPFVVGSPGAVAPPAPVAPPTWQPVPASPRPTTAPVAPVPVAPAPAPVVPGAPAPAPGAPGAAPAPVSPSLPPGTAPSPTLPRLPDPAPSSPVTPRPSTPVPGTPVPGAPDPTSPTSPAPTVPRPTLPGPASPTAPAVPGPTAPAAPAPSAPSPTAPSTPPSDRAVTDPVFGIERLSPGSGSTAGGQRVTLHGTRLPAAPAVLLGGAPAQVVSVDAPSSITVVTPARAAGAVDVTVFDTASTDLSGDRRSTTLRGAFTYTAAAVPAPPTAAPVLPAPAPTAPGTRTPSPAPTTPAPGTPAPGTPAPGTPAPGTSPAPPRTSTPGTRGTLRLVRVTDVDRTLLMHASCGATCTALRF